MPICTDTALPSIDTTVLPFMYQPKLPVENCFTSASISWPLMITFIGSAFSRNWVRDTGHDVLAGMATASDQKPGPCARFGRFKLALAGTEVAAAKCEVGERDDDERVVDVAVEDPALAVGERRGLDAEHLALVGRSRPGQGDAADEHGVERVALDRRVGRDLAEQLDRAAGVAGLLGELAGGGGAWVLAGVDHPARDLEADPVDPRAVLADQHDALVGGQRDHVDPVDAVDQRESLARAGARVGRLDERGGEHAVVVAGEPGAELPGQ